LKPAELTWVRAYFREQVYPVLTPLALDQSHPFPQLGNKELNVIVALDRPGARGEKRVAILPVPRILPRLIPLPATSRGPLRMIFLSEIVKLCAAELFPGHRLAGAHAFRVTRNSDLYIDEEESANLLKKIEEELRHLRRGAAVRLEIEQSVDAPLLATLCHQLGLPPDNVFRLPAPLNLMRLQSLGELDRPDLKFPPFTPVNASPLREPENIFSALRVQDVLLHHPYDSFAPVVDFVEQASRDPQVFAIKQTFYRTSGDSPLVRALIEASKNGKQVTALVELKARFDEANNIQWAKQLEEAGVHVVYGLVGYKTHCKLCLVVRREGRRLRHYAHLGTGNYNPRTARYYNRSQPLHRADGDHRRRREAVQHAHRLRSRAALQPFARGTLRSASAADVAHRARSPQCRRRPARAHRRQDECARRQGDHRRALRPPRRPACRSI